MVTDYYDTPPIPLKSPFLLHEIFIPSTLLTITLCIPHSQWLTTSIFLPVILAAYYRLLQATSANPTTGFFIGTYVAMHAYLTLNLLVFSNPRRDFRRFTPTYGPTTKTKETPNESEGEKYPQESLLQRLGWVFELTQVARGIGWNWQIRSIPPLHPRERTSIATFFRRRIVRLFLMWAWVDLLCSFMRDLDAAFFLPKGNALQHPDSFMPVYRSLFSGLPGLLEEFPPPKGFPEMPHGEDAWLVRGAYALFLRTLRTILSGSAMYVAINSEYTAGSMIAASMGCMFGLGEEGSWRRRWLDWRAWPDLFGGWREGDWGHGILGWWGTAWHSIFKNSFIAPGRFIVSSLNLQNTLAATLIHLTTPFIMSAGLHFACCFTQTGGGLGCVTFFFLQPLGIAFERAFLYVYRRYTPYAVRYKALERATPYLWTVAWFVLVGQYFLNEYRYGGVWGIEPIPVSAVRGLRGDGWLHTSPSIFGGEWWRWHESLGGWGIQL